MVAVTAQTRRAALKEAVAHMKSAAVDTPVLDARLIVQHALGVDWEALFLKADQAITHRERENLSAALTRRASREPVSRIVGRRHFWTLDLAVSPATLDPRADSETLIEAVLAAMPDRGVSLRLLDLGAGTGALLLALLAEYPGAEGIGVDRSAAAIEVARQNADSHGLTDRARFIVGDWAAAIAGAFDLIVSNPPYIARDDLAGLPPDVRDFDPVEALDGGLDGLDAYRAILPSISRLLAPGGLAVIEIGSGQGGAVETIAQSCGLTLRGRRPDLGGVVRALSFGPSQAAVSQAV